MNKRIMSLGKLIEDLKGKLSSGTPAKHRNREESYRAFLKRELQLAQATVARLRGI